MNYIERLVDSVYDACGKAGYDTNSPSVNDIASKTIISFLRSPIYSQAFNNYYLVESEDKSRTHIAIIDNEREAISRTPPFVWKYEYDEYSDDNQDIWESVDLNGELDYKDSFVKTDIDKIIKVIDKLPNDLKYAYQLDQTSPVKFKIIEPGNESVNFISSQGGLSNPYDYGYAKHVLGIKGYSGETDRTYVVAYNEVGCVGVLNLLHNDHNSIEKGFSIAMVSVSPFFKNNHIASVMTDMAVNYCFKNKAPLTITAPTKEGSMYYYPSVVKKHCYRDKLVLEPSVSDVVTALVSSDLSYEKKVEQINKLKSFLDDNFGDEIILSKKNALRDRTFTQKAKLGFRSDGSIITKLISNDITNSHS